MKVGIIGAGIGGLCAAIGLQRAGADVQVFEQAPHVRPGGSGLSIFANGVRALDTLGIGDQLRAITSADAGTFRGGQRQPDGTWLATYPADAIAELRIVDRTDLHRMLTAELADGTLATGTRVQTHPGDTTVTLRDADDGTDLDQYDLVVGADGLRSSTRQAWPRDPGVRYAGYAAWRAITNRPVNLGGEAGETWGVGTRFGMAPLADGRVYWFAVATMPIDQRVDDEMTAVGDLVGQWHAPIPELLEATTASAVHRLPIEELAGDLDTFTRGRVVLLGDAAHAMTPNLGQGGSQAMEDAATLTAVLHRCAGLPNPPATQVADALGRYDDLRRPRTRHIAQRSRQIGRLAHGPGRSASRLRDLVLRATPQAALRRQLRSVHTWEPPRPSP